MDNAMYFSPVEEKDEFSEDDKEDSSSSSSKSEEWPAATVQQHGSKLSRTASKVSLKNTTRRFKICLLKFKTKVLLFYSTKRSQDFEGKQQQQQQRSCRKLVLVLSARAVV